MHVVVWYPVLALACSTATFGATVKADVSAVHKATNDLNKLVQSTHGANQNKDLQIDSASQELVSKYNNAGSDLNALSKKVSSSDFNSILTSLKGTEKSTKAVCTKLRADRANYDEAGISNVITFDIRDLRNAFDGFRSALLSKNPSSSSNGVKAILTTINSDLKVCSKAFPLPPST